MSNIMTCQFFFPVGKDLPESTFVLNRPADFYAKENEPRAFTDKTVLNEDVISSGNLIFS